WKRRVRSDVSLCRASDRMLAMRACSFASLALALRRLADPLALRDKLRESLRKRPSSALWGFGPGIDSPVESVASDDTPRSTPTAPWFSVLGRCERSSVSTPMRTNQRSATREIGAGRTLPVKRKLPRLRTQPRVG